MNWVEVALFRNQAAAEGMRQLFEQTGISARVCHESWLQRLWFVPSRQSKACLEVPATELQSAERLLVQSEGNGNRLRDVIRCPECKSLRVGYPQFARHSLLTNLFLGLAAVIGLAEKDYFCEQCHYNWPREGLRKRRNRPHLAPYYFIEGIEQTAPPRPGSEPQEQQRAA